MTKLCSSILKDLAAAFSRAPVMSKACASVLVSESTGWAWLAASKRGESGYTIDEYLGEKDVPFHLALRQARTIALSRGLQRVEDEFVDGGHWEFTYYKGARVPEIDPVLLSWSDEDLETFGIPDRYKRDAEGNVAYERMWVPLSAQATLAVASANFKT